MQGHGRSGEYKIYHLDYDQLTLEQELETKKLVDYLKLTWEGAFLSPHKNSRIVKTASKHQVRTKIYKGSSQAWRKYKICINRTFHELNEFHE